MTKPNEGAPLSRTPTEGPQVGRRAVVATLLSLPLGCACRPPCPANTPGLWQNASCTVEVTPEVLATPKSARELVERVKDADRRGKRVRMTGSGHSYSDVALNADVLLLPHGLQGVFELKAERLTDAAKTRKLVRVGAGSTIRFLNEKLDKERGLALENLGGWDAQTIVGVAMTATHGSGIEFGPIAEQIVSMQIVGPGGNVVQLEPKDGITKQPYPTTLEEDASIPIRVVQSDELFYAALVSMGSMGVVYSVVVEAVDRFWIKESRTRVSWKDISKPGGYLAEFVAQPRNPGFADHIELTICPYPNKRGDHEVLLTQRWRLKEPKPETPQNRKRGPFGSGNILANAYIRGFAEDGLVDLVDNSDMKGLAKLHAFMMWAIEDKDYQGLSYEVFNLGDFNRFRVHGIEMAFDLRESIEAMNHVIKLAAEQFKLGRHHTVPISLRFVKAAKPLLAMQHGRDTMMMEIGGLVATRESAELLKFYETELMAKFKARPHWGLDLSILKSIDDVRRLYPDTTAAWLRAFDELNPKGTFDGPFTDRLGISKVPRKPE